MSASKKIKIAMLDKEIKNHQLAESIKMKKQALSTKLYRDSMSFSDAEKIANALDCDVALVDRKTGKIYV